MEFLGLDEGQYWKVFDEQAGLVGIIDTMDATYELYAFHDFHIELTFEPDSAILQAVSPFKSGPRLDKYLVEVEISPST